MNQKLINIIIFVFLLLPICATAEVLDADRKISVKLEDGTDVVLYGATRKKRNRIQYYYLPPRLTIGITDDNRPEFLFMKFITDETEDQGGVSGAILHFLVKWGLTTAQEEDLREEIETNHNGLLAGAVTMLPSAEDGPSFYVVSATLGDNGMTSSLVTSGQASLMPGGRAAAAARLGSDGAQLLSRTFEEDTAITDVTAVFNMAYQAQIPAAKGSVVIDWSRIERESEKVEEELKRSVESKNIKVKCVFVFCSIKNQTTYRYDYNEVRHSFDYLSENKYITFKFEENYTDERVDTIREAFIDYFVSSMTTQTVAAPESSSDDDEKTGTYKDLGVSTKGGYTYNLEKIKRSIKKGRQVFNMEYKLTVEYPFQVVGNMKSWYAEASSDPNAVQSVLLADPFYKRRDIVMMLGGDMRDMFEDHIDLVTVDIEKDRGNQPRFTDTITFDEQYLEDKGNRATLTYARGDNAQADNEGYRYAVKWSFRDQREYIEPFQEASWEGITLNAPIESRTLTLEADPDELEQIGVTRVTAQVSYPVLGEMDETNIQMSVVGGEPLIESKIFMDRQSQGYIYRIIFNHKTQGRLALPWTARRSDNYIYATIPEELQQNLLDEIVEGAVQVAKDAVVNEAEDQLSRFNSLLNGG